MRRGPVWQGRDPLLRQDCGIGGGEQGAEVGHTPAGRFRIFRLSVVLTGPAAGAGPDRLYGALMPRFPSKARDVIFLRLFNEGGG